MDIHGYQRRLEDIIAAIKRAKISKENKELLMKFYSYLCAKGFSTARIEHYMHHMKHVSELISKNFSELEKEDIEEKEKCLVLKLEQSIKLK